MQAATCCPEVRASAPRQSAFLPLRWPLDSSLQRRQHLAQAWSHMSTILAEVTIVMQHLALSWTRGAACSEVQEMLRMFSAPTA